MKATRHKGLLSWFTILIVEAQGHVFADLLAWVVDVDYFRLRFNLTLIYDSGSSTTTTDYDVIRVGVPVKSVVARCCTVSFESTLVTEWAKWTGTYFGSDFELVSKFPAIQLEGSQVKAFRLFRRACLISISFRFSNEKTIVLV